MNRSTVAALAFLITSQFYLCPEGSADPGSLSREKANEFFAIHEGRWTGKVKATIGEAAMNKVDGESLNYLDMDYLESNGLLSYRNYGPRSGGRGFSHYDAEKKVIRGINHGVGGVVTYHEIYQGDEAWIRTSKQVLADGTTREFYSTIRFTDNNQTIQIEIWQSKDGKEGPSQTNVWRRIE